MIARPRQGTQTATGAPLRQRLIVILRNVPAGRVTTFEAISVHLGASPAEIATLLLRLTGDERQMTPWHKVVAKGGAIGRGPWRERQFALLVREGIPVSPAGIVQEMASRAVTDLAAIPSAPLEAPPSGKPPGRSRGMKDRPGH